MGAGPTVGQSDTLGWTLLGYNGEQGPAQTGLVLLTLPLPPITAQPILCPRLCALWNEVQWSIVLKISPKVSNGALALACLLNFLTLAVQIGKRQIVPPYGPDFSGSIVNTCLILQSTVMKYLNTPVYTGIIYELFHKIASHAIWGGCHGHSCDIVSAFSILLNWNGTFWVLQEAFMCSFTVSEVSVSESQSITWLRICSSTHTFWE